MQNQENGSVFVLCRKTRSANMIGNILNNLKAKVDVNVQLINDTFFSTDCDMEAEICLKLSECTALLAIIDKDWLSVNSENGKRKIDEPYDYVRIMIEEAMDQNIPVIPAVIEGCDLPGSDDLPSEIRGLAFYKEMVIQTGDEFNNDIDLVASSLNSIVKKSRVKNGVGLSSSAAKKLLFLGIFGAAICIGGGIVVFSNSKFNDKALVTDEMSRVNGKFYSMAESEDEVKFSTPFISPPKVTIGIPSEDSGLSAFLNGSDAVENTVITEVTNTGFKWKNSGQTSYDLRWIATGVEDGDPVGE